MKKPCGLENFKNFLKDQRISYDQLAYHLDSSASRICRIVNGYAEFHKGEKEKISKILKISSDVFTEDKRG